MDEKSAPLNITDPDLQKILDGVQVGLLLCDGNRRMLLENRAAEAISRLAGIASPEQPCHQRLFSLGTPCEGCPLGVEGDGAAAKRQSLTLERAGGNLYLKVFCQPWQANVLLTIHDVTQEITLLRCSDLDRKELQAKNILLERRRRVNAGEQEVLTQLMDNLPEALLTVDEHFQVQRRNRAMAAMAEGESHSHCYVMFGYDGPCPGCPAAGGFANATGRKKSQELGGRFFTELFSAAPNGRGGLLLFREITRQVGLIEQIRVNQAEIAHKNEILSLLVEFGTHLQKGHDAEEVVSYFLDTVLPHFHRKGVALFVHDVRAGSLWLAQQRQMAVEDFKALGRASLARELQDFHAEGRIPEDKLPWPTSRQIPLVGAKGQRVGLLLLEGEPAAAGFDFLRLVTEPLGAYLQSQLLYRQLEEKANKDPLTGLFNRGYLASAMDEEREKFEKYGVHHAVVLADLNGLKKLNDLHGHDCGDQMIVVASMTMQKSLRSTDIIARTGGDEFVILLANTTDEDAGHFVRRLQREVFADLRVPLLDGTEFPVTVSLGKAGSDKHPVESLLTVADREMYAAKQEFYRTAERYR